MIVKTLASCDFYDWHPPQYVVYKMQKEEETIQVDGQLGDAAWTRVPWINSFGDLRGPAHWAQPYFATKVKLRYDTHALYLGV